jgi:DNA repair exonuclease SbcCD ATPase subunit
MAATKTSLETDVAILKSEVIQIATLFSKLENALDKIAEVTHAVGQMLAVHSQQLESTSDQVEEQKQSLENYRKMIDIDIKEVHSRLTTSSREMKQEMSKEIEKVLDSIKDLKTHVVEKTDKLEARITSLEKWRWILIGALAIGSILFPKLAPLFTLG